LRLRSRPSLDRVDPVIFKVRSNAKSPDVPGGVDIAMVRTNVSTSVEIRHGLTRPSMLLAKKKDVDARHKAGHDERKQS